jgi:hypothetical protein
VYEAFKEHFGETEKWANLDKAYINFTHWTFVKGDHESIPYRKKGFYVSWLRHDAYICQASFPSINLVIPMAFPTENGFVTPECVSYIVISVNNCDDTEGFSLDYLSKEMVEGVTTTKAEPDSKKYKIDETEGNDRQAEIKYTEFDDHLNVSLTLHAVKFINPSGVISAMDDDDCWVDPSVQRPYIAFAMSMGHTDCTDKLFIAEKVSYHMHFSDKLE